MAEQELTLSLEFIPRYFLHLSLLHYFKSNDNITL